MKLRYGQSNTETQLSLEKIIKTRKNKRTKNSSCEPCAHFNSPKCPSATLERPEHFLATGWYSYNANTIVLLASSAIEAVPRHRRRITKTTAVNHKDIDTHGVNRMPLRRPWLIDKKNRFLDKVWTPQFSTTPPKPFLVSFSTHLGDQTLARSIWKRSQLPDAFFRLAQGLILSNVSTINAFMQRSTTVPIP